jgi:predicted alpha/beta hydrolase family esterase
MWAAQGSGHLADYLRAELEPRITVLAPEMPDASVNPQYVPWRDEIAAQLSRIDGAALVVGHSLGGSVALKYLAAARPPCEIAGLFLVSVPWWGENGWGYEEFGFDDAMAEQLPSVPTFLYRSRDDPDVSAKVMSEYARRLPHAAARTIEGNDHSFVLGLPQLVDDIRSITRL